MINEAYWTFRCLANYLLSEQSVTENAFCPSLLDITRLKLTTSLCEPLVMTFPL